ncbi:carbamoyl-phosphate synthase domain-containing protein [Pseudomonas aeruginosa]
MFNTAMTGYRRKSLPHPSLRPADRHPDLPHIGNTGTPREDAEANRGSWAAATLIIRDLPLIARNWRSNGRCLTTSLNPAPSPPPASIPVT